MDDREMLEWQPIETATKDYVEVILYDPSNVPPVFTGQKVYGEWSASVENRVSCEDDFYGDPPKHPTHWMPLPKPPAIGKEGK